ncbi:MAG TPA: DUF86 domain-containing protein [Syntrophorhabdaceae bacterium]|nr:DUF86 domain-containing protein [Syntrophorhabdaceae bacterium]HQH42723.1 DUF86 domain-containing protein [Syntrophorhabdaceae bacterium]
MRKSDIQSKIDVLVDNIEKLSYLQKKDFKEFTSDFRNIDSALHRLQTSIQALLDMGNYIISSLGLKTPDTNADVFKILCREGYLRQDRMNTYIQIIQFRNRIVHIYNHIDTETLYDILVNELHDIKEIFQDMLEIIENDKT